MEVDSKNQQSETLFKRYCVGHAADNKKRSENTLLIFPTEVFPFVGGELKADSQPLNVKGVDKDGNAYELTVAQSNFIKAEWLRGDSNRDNAPDVRRAEKVEIFRYADTDQFYWRSLGMDNDKRRLETITMVLSNRREEKDEPLAEDEKWVIEASTHDKHITIKTTKSDNEPYAYLQQMNLADGQYVVTDDIGNQVHINSAENEVLLKNADGSYVQVIKNVINIFAADDINIKTTRYKLDASESITMGTAKTTLNSSDSVTVTTTTTKIDSPNNEITGNTAIGGTLNVAGKSTLAGLSSSGGGGAVITGGLKVDDKDVGGTHTHSQGGSGPPN